MNNRAPIEHFIVLRLAGGPFKNRCLNVAGRWASAGSEAIPILSWSDLVSAKADAEKASLARGREVEVGSVGRNNGSHSYGSFAPYGKQHAGALMGYLPYSAAAARKLEAERKRLMGYAKVILAGGIDMVDADPVSAISAMKSAAIALRQAGIGNGSWVSSAQGLTGAKTFEVLALVVLGELPCDPDITKRDILMAIGIAKLLTERGMSEFRANVFAAIYESALALHRVGAIDDAALREFDEDLKFKTQEQEACYRP